ncbi:hypothetical protein [Piscinibacter defluvii]|uniref:hypothetical protein n=1 Tax=Piscinibacter defluvii TaxID=1796922 RepID=UPI000FDCEBE2|nr:hypothetical protein [Piscinibacter defluvii]
MWAAMARQRGTNLKTEPISHCTPERVAALDAALAQVRAEVLRAIERYPAFNSSHEGYAVIAEELDELWDDVKRNFPQGAREEAIQVAAMGVRFIMDVKVPA